MRGRALVDHGDVVLELILAWLAATLVVDDAPIAVEVLTLEPVAAGARAEVSLVVLEPPERELPLGLRLTAPAELALVDDRLDWRSVADPLAPLPRIRARFDAPHEPGRYEITGQLRYWVCGERWCRVKTGAVRWTVEVEALSSGGDRKVP